MQLQDGKTYATGDGRRETVGGVTKEFPDWVWTIQGNWYERSTGRCIGYHQIGERTRENPGGVWEHYVMPASWRDLVRKVAP